MNNIKNSPSPNQSRQTNRYAGSPDVYQRAEIRELPISRIDEFRNHPFPVRMDESMEQLVISIRERGVITPILVRPKEDGRYELISGHRRTRACQFARISTIRALVQPMSDDEAIIRMVDSNLQRAKLLPSEKAKAFQMRLDALTRQGKESDLFVEPGRRSSEVLAEAVGESKTQIFRYLRLNHLVPGLLRATDIGSMALRSAVEISYLTEEEQRIVWNHIESSGVYPSLSQAKQLRLLSRNDAMTMSAVQKILGSPVPCETIRFSSNRLLALLPGSMTRSQKEMYVIEALEYYQKYHNADLAS